MSIAARSSADGTIDDRTRPSFSALEYPAVPKDMQFDDMASLEDALPLRDLEGCFPNLSRKLGADRVRSIVQLSTLVGMACPGLHSIFSEFSVSLAENEAEAVQWRVTRTDDRFRMIWMNVRGAIQGEVIAFARFPPVAPPTLEALRTVVEPSEFKGRRALVVGGSRGLGAVTAKLLAAGGAAVIITYARGAEEALGLAAEIDCDVMALDVTSLGQAHLPDGITHLYYYATPRIFRQGTETFSPAVFSEFCTFYIGAFNDLLLGLRATSPGLRSLFYPSTSALDDRPRGMTEYVMAKAAAEELCTDLVTKDLAISMPRLPRIETDQTATVPPVPSADAVQVLLPLLRAETP